MSRQQRSDCQVEGMPQKELFCLRGLVVEQVSCVVAQHRSRWDWLSDGAEWQAGASSLEASHGQHRNSAERTTSLPAPEACAPGREPDTLLNRL